MAKRDPLEEEVVKGGYYPIVGSPDKILCMAEGFATTVTGHQITTCTLEFQYFQSLFEFL